MTIEKVFLSILKKKFSSAFDKEKNFFSLLKNKVNLG